MTKFTFDETGGAWKSMSGKKWVRPIPINMAGSVMRLFHDKEDGTTEYHDYDLDGRVVVGDGPSDKHLDNIIGGWTTPFARIKPTEAVEEVGEEKYEHTELKASIEVTEIPAFIKREIDVVAALQSKVSDAEQKAINQTSLKKSLSHTRYDQLVAETFDKIIELGIKKGGEYAGDFDRLANFRRNGGNLELPMDTIWAVYAGKHWDAIMQYVKDNRNGTVRDRMETIEGRAIDLMVYLLLFLLMLEEQSEGNLRG